MAAASSVRSPHRSPATPDRCPGVLKLIDSADGKLARIRIPGGFVTTQGLRCLARAAQDLGDGRLELTSRANVQIRALASDAGVELAQRLALAGLMPSESHEQVRNICASPFAGLTNERDLSDLVRRLDAAICADERLVELSGRFLFGFDDGCGDVAALRPDVLAVIGADGVAVNGIPVGSASEDVVRLMIDAAHAFLDERAEQQSGAWRLADLDQGQARVRERLGADRGTALVALQVSTSDGAGGNRRRNGAVDQIDGGRSLVAAAPLGRLTAAQADVLAELVLARPARLTPWRSVVIPDAQDDRGTEALVAAGLGGRAPLPWLTVSACAGKPGCAQALADVQHDAMVSAGRWGNRVVHWSGCARRCGRPASTEVDVVAGPTGYVVTTSQDATRGGDDA